MEISKSSKRRKKKEEKEERGRRCHRDGKNGNPDTIPMPARSQISVSLFFLLLSKTGKWTEDRDGMMGEEELLWQWTDHCLVQMRVQKQKDRWSIEAKQRKEKIKMKEQAKTNRERKRELSQQPLQCKSQKQHVCKTRR